MILEYVHAYWHDRIKPHKEGTKQFETADTMKKCKFKSGNEILENFQQDFYVFYSM